mmetsp:Transcript_21138/g.53820  ORF Transcript_21138/g.53820 Transcript_21138/m.53820 type:complete len:829 (+) Transcript_21138:108-2594(+)
MPADLQGGYAPDVRRQPAPRAPARTTWKGAVGLSNLGNTCYLNSALQCLAHTHALQKYFRHHQHTLLAPDKLDSKTWPRRLVQTFVIWFERAWGEYPEGQRVQKGYYCPEDLLRVVQQLNPLFADYQQQDSQEFLRCVLDCLHEELREEVMVEVPPALSPPPRLPGEAGGPPPMVIGTSEPNSQLGSPTASAGPSWPFCAASDASATDPGEITLHDSAPATVTAQPAVDPQGPASPAATQNAAKEEPAKPKTAFRSIISEIFQGRSVSAVRCLSCGHTSRTVETFFDLSVPIPSNPQDVDLRASASGGRAAPACSPARTSTGTSMWNLKQMFGAVKALVWQDSQAVEVLDCIKKYCQPEHLTGRDSYACEKCKTKRDAQKQMRLLELPEVLCVQLKRFRCEGGWLSGTKNSKPVTVPVDECLDLRDLLDDKAEATWCQYELFGVIQHFGSIGSGHYISFARQRKRPDMWFEFDDARVRECSADEVRSAEPYVMFFQRVPAPEQRAARAAFKRDRDQTANKLRAAPNGPRPAEPTEETADSIPMSPSVSVAYVPKHWYIRLTTMCTPGPIDTYNHLCPHDKIGCSSEAWAAANFIAISEQYCQALLRQHGGGPMLRSLDLCEKCCDLLAKYNARRKLEHALACKYDTKEVGGNQGSYWYLLDNVWVSKWKRYVKAADAEHIKSMCSPGPISNDRLFIPAKEGEPPYMEVRQNLRAKVEYHGVNALIWGVLHFLHGGGPVVCRQEFDLKGIPTPAEDLLPEELTPSAWVSKDSIVELSWQFVDECKADWDVYRAKYCLVESAEEDEPPEQPPPTETEASLDDAGPEPATG